MIAVVESQPVRLKSPLHDVDTQAKLKFENKKQQDRIETRKPYEHELEPDQPRVKTSLHFEAVGAAHLDLVDLEDKVPKKSIREHEGTTVEAKESLENDVDALLQDLEI
jgi:hypothetical protein